MVNDFLHLLGAAWMGDGGVTALGCTVGQGLSGLSTLSLTSAIAVAGVEAGIEFDKSSSGPHRVFSIAEKATT